MVVPQPEEYSGKSRHWQCPRAEHKNAASRVNATSRKIMLINLPKPDRTFRSEDTGRSDHTTEQHGHKYSPIAY